MADITEIFGTEGLSEELKSQVQEAWENKLSEAREDISAELREEFAQRYENDKSQIVEAMDNMMSDALKKEISEFAEDKAKVVKERVFLFNELKKLKIVKPFPSQANYIFCKVENFDAMKLCEEMFEKHNIFMKHYEHKVFKNHIRISVRSREDNLKLIKALKKAK